MKCPKCGNASTKLMKYQENAFGVPDADTIKCKKCGKEFYLEEVTDYGLSHILAMQEGLDQDEWVTKYKEGWVRL